MLKRSVRIVASIALAMSLMAWSSARAQDHGEKHEGKHEQQEGQAKQMPPANPNQGYFGAKFAQITDEKAEELGLDSQDGVVIMEILPDSPAARAGLKPDDVVKKLDDKDVDGVEAFVAVMRASKPDQQLKVSIIRDKKPEDLTVTLAKRPASMDALQKQMEKERMEKEKDMEKEKAHEHEQEPATKPS